MIAQWFLNNAIYFSCVLMLIRFYHVPSNRVPLCGLTCSIGNLCGPLILARCPTPRAASW
jgi:hypothetical protein